MDNAYATDKIRAHLNVLQEMRETGISSKLLSVHLMPQNVCNQSCEFCSYRMPDNKNSSVFNESAHIDENLIPELFDDFEALGVQGIEVTGGGEPLAYPNNVGLWGELARRNFDTALVTNGTLMTDPLAQLVTQKMKWARVSIDAAHKQTYTRMRRASSGHFARAWKAVELLRKHAPDDPDFRLGVGFVLSNENIGEVFEFVALAWEAGADNVRIASTFSDQGMNYYDDHDALRNAVEAAHHAESYFNSDNFTVHNLLPQRLWESNHPVQDYKRCPSKDVLCVVEGECKVYTCCTFTGSDMGCYGKFNEHPGGFKGLWQSASQWRKDWDCREACKVSCLYHDRNVSMNELIDGDEMPTYEKHIHEGFI